MRDAISSASLRAGRSPSGPARRGPPGQSTSPLQKPSPTASTCVWSFPAWVAFASHGGREVAQLRLESRDFHPLRVDHRRVGLHLTLDLGELRGARRDQRRVVDGHRGLAVNLPLELGELRGVPRDLRRVVSDLPPKRHDVPGVLVNQTRVVRHALLERGDPRRVARNHRRVARYLALEVRDPRRVPRDERPHAVESLLHFGDLHGVCREERGVAVDPPFQFGKLRRVGRRLGLEVHELLRGATSAEQKREGNQRQDEQSLLHRSSSSHGHDGLLPFVGPLIIYARGLFATEGLEGVSSACLARHSPDADAQ